MSSGGSLEIGSSPLDPEVLQLPAGLSGQLLFAEERAQPHFRILSLDLASGALGVVFGVEPGHFLFDFARSVDGTLALSYAAPDEPSGFNTADLYLATGQRSPERWIRAEKGVVLTDPAWSADGRWLYFTQARSDASEPPQVRRASRDGAEVQLVADSAHWPVFSRDGRWLLYIVLNPQSWSGGLRLVDTQTDTYTEHPAPDLHGLANPALGPSGRWLYFTAQKAASADLAAAKHAGSHGRDAAWWRIQAGGGEPERVAADTELFEGVYDADNGILAYSTPLGLYAVQPHGEPVQLVRSRALRAVDAPGGAP